MPRQHTSFPGTAAVAQPFFNDSQRSRYEIDCVFFFFAWYPYNPPDVARYCRIPAIHAQRGFPSVSRATQQTCTVCTCMRYYRSLFLRIDIVCQAILFPLLGRHCPVSPGCDSGCRYTNPVRDIFRGGTGSLPDLDIITLCSILRQALPLKESCKKTISPIQREMLHEAGLSGVQIP